MKETILRQTETWFELAEELLNPTPSVLLNDWPQFNQYLGGFRANEFTVLCGPSGKGKTTLMANISAQLLKQDVKHFVMPIETGHKDYMLRVLSVLEGKDLNTGEIIPVKEVTNLGIKHMDSINKNVIYFSNREMRMTVDDLIKELDYMVKQDCKIAIIDNFNFFLQPTDIKNAVAEMDKVVHELVLWVKKNPMHILMIFHPKKTDNGRVTNGFDVKGSSNSIQEAQNVLLFNHPDPFDKDLNQFDRELKFEKIRRRGKFTGRTIIFQNNETRYSEKGKRL